MPADERQKKDSEMKNKHLLVTKCRINGRGVVTIPASSDQVIKSRDRRGSSFLVRGGAKKTEDLRE